MANYTLLDAAAQHEKYPDTFEIPDDDDLDRIVVGDYVKLVFLPGAPAMKPGFVEPHTVGRGALEEAALTNGERMWVKVTNIATRIPEEEKQWGPPFWWGTLANDPVNEECFGHFRDFVTFFRYNIVDWQYNDKAPS
jgi:hypothetical protein